MDIIVTFFNYISSLGSTVMMPIIIAIMGMIFGAGIGKSLRAGLMVGIGFIGLNLVIGLLGANLAPAVQQMSSNLGLDLSIIDVGWPSSAAIAFATNVGTFIIPVCILVNILMLAFRCTQTVDVDIWNFWHFAFTGSLVAILTGSVMIGILAACLNMMIILVIADYTAKGVEETLHLPGVSIPHGYSGAYAPIAIALDRIIDKIPGLNKINFNIDTLQKKFGIFGEPIFIGTFLGIVIGIAAGMSFGGFMAMGVTMGAVLVLIPKMAALLMEGLMPISDAAADFIQKRFKNAGKIYIGLDSAVGVGHPLTLTLSLILVPISILLAVILPGNKLLPFTDLSVFPFMFVLITPVIKGNAFRGLLIGTICVIAALYIGTDLSPLITKAAAEASFDMGSATAISSLCDGGNPLTWAFVKFNGLGGIGIAMTIAIAVLLAVLNHRRIAVEAKELAKEMK